MWLEAESQALGTATRSGLVSSGCLPDPAQLLDPEGHFTSTLADAAAGAVTSSATVLYRMHIIRSCTASDLSSG